MAELTLRDLCRWDRRLSLLCPPGLSEEAALDRTISWAVSVRAAPPFLPPLRGDELVVLSGRILREILAAGTADADELLETLAQSPVAALLTEPNLFDEPVGSLPFLLFPGPIPLDLEATLNRLLTEQRRALYRLSTELTRELSRAALTGGLEAVLRAAALASNRALVLQDSEGRVLAQAGTGASPAVPTVLALARSHPAVRTVAEGGDERLLTTISVGGRPIYLSLLAREGTSAERDRLVLSLVAGLCSSLLSHESRLARPAPVSQLVSDILFGRLTESSLVHAAQRLGLEIDGEIVVVLLGSSDTSRREQILQHITEGATRERSTALGSEIAFLLTPTEAARVEARARALASELSTPLSFLALAAKSRHSSLPWYLAIARPLARLKAAPDGLREARFLIGLMQRGAIPGPVARFDELDDVGPFAVLYLLWGHPEADDFQRRLLGPLLDEDERSLELLQTLAAFLELGSASEVAIRLGIHRNTVAYRLAKVAELTGRNLSDTRDRLLLHLALLLRALPPPEPRVPQ